jgi:hypothetical protein
MGRPYLRKPAAIVRSQCRPVGPADVTTRRAVRLARRLRAGHATRQADNPIARGFHTRTFQVEVTASRRGKRRWRPTCAAGVSESPRAGELASVRICPPRDDRKLAGAEWLPSVPEAGRTAFRNEADEGQPPAPRPPSCLLCPNDRNGTTPDARNSRGRGHLLQGERGYGLRSPSLCGSAARFPLQTRESNRGSPPPVRAAALTQWAETAPRAVARRSFGRASSLSPGAAGPTRVVGLARYRLCRRCCWCRSGFRSRSRRRFERSVRTRSANPFRPPLLRPSPSRRIP